MFLFCLEQRLQQQESSDLWPFYEAFIHNIKLEQKGIHICMHFLSRLKHKNETKLWRSVILKYLSDNGVAFVDGAGSPERVAFHQQLGLWIFIVAVINKQHSELISTGLIHMLLYCEYLFLAFTVSLISTPWSFLHQEKHAKCFREG